MTTAVAPNFRQDARVIGLVGVAHGVSHFSQLVLPALFPWLKDAFNLSYAELGFAVTMFFVVSGIGQALAGFVVDRVGARAVLFSGLALLALGILLMSQSQNYAMLIAGSMVAGIGNSIFHPADYTLLNRCVSAERLGHAFSVHGITGNLGWAASTVFVTSMAGLFGWHTAFLLAGCIPLIVLAVLYAHRDLLRTDEVKGAVVASHKETQKASGSSLAFMKIPAVWMCFGFFFITAMALGGIQSFSSPSLRALYGMSLGWAATGFTVYMLASAAGMIAGGFVAAKSKRHERNIAVAFVVAGLMAMVIATGAVPAVVAIVLMGVVGFGSGIAGPSRDLMIRAAAPKGATGRVYGIVYSGLDTGSSLAPLLFGALMDHGHPSWVFVAIGAFQMLAIFTALGVGTNNARKAGQAQAA
jgi:MFS family permease